MPIDDDGTERAELSGGNVRVDLPSGEATGLAVYFHGQGGDVDELMDLPYFDPLVEDGWAVASGDLGGDAWGSPDAVTAAGELVAWAEDEAGVDATLLIGGSMGGLTSLNAMLEAGEAPACWYGTMPVVDIAAVDTVPGSEQQISAAWGRGPDEIDGPADRIDELPLETRYRILSSPDDANVPPGPHADALAAGLGSRGADVTTLEVSGGHGDASHFQADDLAAFAADCR